MYLAALLDRELNKGGVVLSFPQGATKDHLAEIKGLCPSCCSTELQCSDSLLSIDLCPSIS